MSERVTFGDIHRLLADLGFVRGSIEGKPYVVFKHPSSGVLFMFRPHRSNERIDSINLGSVRLHLVQNGFLEDDEFDEVLRRLARDRIAGPKKK